MDAPSLRLAPLAVAAALLLVPLAAGVGPLQDDAGSGRDAGGDAAGAVPIEPGIVYEGLIGGIAVDRSDWYAFHAEAGQYVEARATGSLACFYLYHPAGHVADFTCGLAYLELGRISTVANATGTWYFAFGYIQAQYYQFSVGVGEAAPAPLGVSLADGGGGLPAVAPASETDAHVVIAVVDTGINPYHDFFAAPGLTAHPSRWLAGFPGDAEQVPLSLAETDFAAALAKDNATWNGLARTSYDAATDSYDTHLYTFPGTRIVGAVSFGEYDDPFGGAGTRAVLDEHSHGTHSAGLVAGANLPAADGNVLIVMVEVGQGDFEEGVRWAARQPWIDALSLSIGVLANAPFTFSPVGDRRGMEWATLEAAASGKPVFMASGNGFTGTGVGPDHCTTYTSPYTGPEWVTRIGAADPGSGNPSSWHCLPVEAVARTNVPSPVHDGLSASSTATGTSAATPNAAGHFAHLLLAARRAGVEASRVDAETHLLQAAKPAAPAVAFASEPSTEATAPLDQGYGLIDSAALSRAKDTLLAGAGPTPRPELETWFAADAAVRRALWGPGSATGGGIVSFSDAGAGRDASPEAPVAVEPGVRYEGMLLGIGVDPRDSYTFTATAGSILRLADFGPGACWSLLEPGSTTPRSLDCLGLGTATPLSKTGTYRLDAVSFTPTAYRFGFTLDGTAPPAMV